MKPVAAVVSSDLEGAVGVVTVEDSERHAAMLVVDLVLTALTTGATGVTKSRSVSLCSTSPAVVVIGLPVRFLLVVVFSRSSVFRLFSAFVVVLLQAHDSYACICMFPMLSSYFMP